MKKIIIPQHLVEPPHACLCAIHANQLNISAACSGAVRPATARQSQPCCSRAQFDKDGTRDGIV